MQTNTLILINFINVDSDQMLRQYLDLMHRLLFKVNLDSRVTVPQSTGSPPWESMGMRKIHASRADTHKFTPPLVCNVPFSKGAWLWWPRWAVFHCSLTDLWTVGIYQSPELPGGRSTRGCRPSSDILVCLDMTRLETYAVSCPLLSQMRSGDCPSFFSLRGRAGKAAARPSLLAARPSPHLKEVN